MSPVRYELVSYIPEDDILHSPIIAAYDLWLWMVPVLLHTQKSVA
jgi:hypothetical protein